MVSIKKDGYWIHPEKDTLYRKDTYNLLTSGDKRFHILPQMRHYTLQMYPKRHKKAISSLTTVNKLTAIKHLLSPPCPIADEP